MQPTFSIIIATGRTSRGSIKHCDTHLFENTLNSLQNQSFKDFEVVIVDSLYKKRDLAIELVKLGQWEFPWRVVRPKSWWLDHKLWSLQNAFNRGFCASYGKFMFFCGDCCVFPPQSLETAKTYLDQGYSPAFLFVYKTASKLTIAKDGCWKASEFSSVEDARAAGLFADPLHRDSRWTHVEKLGGFAGPDKIYWDMIYGYHGVKREDFIHVNGYDENFDGDKALGDVELGSRLNMAGRWSVCLSKDLFVYEQQHNSVDPETFMCGITSIRSNYDLIYLMRNKGTYRANSNGYTYEECCDVIRGRITNIPAWPNYKITPDEPNYIYQRQWMDNQPIFDLSQLE